MKNPVPIPFKLRLQDMRTRMLPILMFAMTAFIASMLWHDAVSPSMLLGEVSAHRVSVNSTSAATIQRLTTRRLALVKAGDPIAELSPTDTRASLDLIQSDLSLLRLKANETSANDSQGRMMLDYERLHLDWMSEKIALVQSEANQRRANMDLEVSKGLVKEATQSPRFLQEAELAKASADAEVQERKSLVEALGSRLQVLRDLQPTFNAKPDDSLKLTINNLETRLSDAEQSQRLITLRSPIDGIVTSVLHSEGESIAANEPLITITALQPGNIIGYLRQPLPVEPAIGMEVEVRSHGRSRQKSISTVVHVGSQFELITNPSLHPSTTPEVGLPVEVLLPPDLKLRPGEIVSLVIKAPKPENL